MSKLDETIAVAEKGMRFAFPVPVRLFEQVQPEVQQLARTQKYILVGETVDLDGIWVMFYDHRYQLAVKVGDPGGPLYALLREIDKDLDALCQEVIDAASRVNESKGEKKAVEAMNSIVMNIILAVRKYGKAIVRAVN